MNGAILRDRIAIKKNLIGPLVLWAAICYTIMVYLVSYAHFYVTGDKHWKN